MTVKRNFFQRIPARSLPPPIERRTHIAIADEMARTLRPGWWFSHIGSGEKRSEATGALLKRMGLKPGVPDFLLIAPNGAHYWLELKRGLAPLTEGQEAFIEMCRLRGIPFFVARNYDAAVEQLRKWGAL